MSPTVVIDPGHGGSTRVGGSSPNNATAPSGLLEKDVTLDLGRRVAALLAPRASVVLTRSDDSNVSLADRARVARDHDADVFLSIHLNGWRDPAVDGSEAWVATHAGADSRALARSVLDRVLTVTQARDRGVQAEDFGVLLPQRLGARTAASLLEVAFLTNPSEAQRLAGDDYRQALAQAIADGIAARLAAVPAPTAPAPTPTAPAPAAAQAVVESAGRCSTCAPSALRAALATPQAYARPLYDTGEHVLTGDDLYPDQLLVGASPGVSFSYGELIAMGDLYASADDMMAASADELTRLKQLIDRSASYYRGGKADPSLDVSDDEWNDATGHRYLRLAQDNYTHFSPNTWFDDAVAAAASLHGDNRSTWETYHRRAIAEMQQLALQSTTSSPLPVWPLILNAFGDHFLTDAFAAGHLINKEVMIAYFRASFFSGDSLNDAANAFFDRVADAAYTDDVAEKFSRLTVDYPLCAFGWCLRWHAHPALNSKSRFRDFLAKAAVQQPEAVANFAVKALHDKLNAEGVQVVNDAGDPQWTLTGDGHLNDTSLDVMRRAVRQSVADINDPSILASNLDVTPFLAGVWKFVPRPIPSEVDRIKRLVHEYTDPTSETLSTAAATLIRDEVDALIQAAVDSGAVQRH